MWRTRGTLVSKTGVRVRVSINAAARSDAYMMRCFCTQEYVSGRHQLQPGRFQVEYGQRDRHGVRVVCLSCPRCDDDGGERSIEHRDGVII